MKIKKVLFLVVLIIVLMISLPSSANATTTIEYVDTSFNIKYLLDKETKEATVIGYIKPVSENVTIPSKIVSDGCEYIVTKIEDLAFLQCDTVRSITIPKTVKSIGTKTFNRCDYLEEINIENGNTIYSSAEGVLFNYDKKELIRYPEGKNETTYVIPTDVVKIEEGAFWRNQSLENILIPSTVTQIGTNAFQLCSSLESIIIPEGVTSIEGFTFDGCSSLTSIIIPNSVTSIGTYAFYGCSSLIDLSIPDSVVYVEDNAFYNSILDNKIYYVTNSLSNLSSSNIKNFIKTDEEEYKTTLIANEGYKLPQNISIKINKIELNLNDYEYDFITGDLKISIDKINGDIEIEAIGDKIHKLILDTNKGKFPDGKTRLEFGDVTKCDMTKIENPVRDGYIFKGWYTEKIGGIALESVMSSEDGIKEDTTFYAQWEENSSEGDLSIPEDVEKDEANNQIVDRDDKADKDDTPTTGFNSIDNSLILFVGILAIISMAIVVTTKIKNK